MRIKQDTSSAIEEARAWRIGMGMRGAVLWESVGFKP